MTKIMFIIFQTSRVRAFFSIFFCCALRMLIAISSLTSSTTGSSVNHSMYSNTSLTAARKRYSPFNLLTCTIIVVKNYLLILFSIIMFSIIMSIINIDVILQKLSFKLVYRRIHMYMSVRFSETSRGFICTLVEDNLYLFGD